MDETNDIVDIKMRNILGPGKDEYSTVPLCKLYPGISMKTSEIIAPM